MRPCNQLTRIDAGQRVAGIASQAENAGSIPVTRSVKSQVSVSEAGRVKDVTRKVLTAAKFERLSPDEQDQAFESSIVTDLDAVPAEFLAKVRARVEARIAASDSATKT